MRPAATLTGILIDPWSQVPPYEQLKNEVKFACTFEKLKEGDVLPSIRELARRLGVGDGVVRRAYRELCETGLLVTARRKHVAVTRPLVAASESETARAGAEQCDQLIEWAARHRLSAIALGRLLVRRALARETVSPSYLFVDICTLAAQQSVARISKAWGIKIAGVSVADFASLWNDKARRFSAFLVNHYLYEDVAHLAGESAVRIFSVRTRVDERLRRKIERLPPRAAVMFVVSGEDFPRAGEAIIRHYKDVFGGKLRFHVREAGEIPDPTSFVLAGRYRLFLFSPVLWEKLPARIQRMTNVAPAFNEPDPRSLEETRVAAGVLL